MRSIRWAAPLLLGLAACSPGRPEEQPRLITCVDEEAHGRATAAPAQNDLTVGPVTWPGLRSWAAADPDDFAGGQPGHYKVGIVVKAATTVTVSIAGPARLTYGQRAGYSPASSITFQACDDFDTVYFGGFHAPERTCVPVTVEERGEPPVRATVSFFAGPCAGSSG
ncbi:hypothetical protein [Actinoplanes sp. NPDC048796]|uniref:hypothetical protein n=1 Tax=unclassified Actinoplanes TaxID=2626549 RepID=UPI0033C6FC50